MQINKEEPIKFKKVSISHSRFVEGTILPQPAPANVVSTKKYDSIYFSFQLGVNIFHQSILYQPAISLEKSTLPVINHTDVQKCMNTLKQKMIKRARKRPKVDCCFYLRSKRSKKRPTSPHLSSLSSLRQAKPILLYNE